MTIQAFIEKAWAGGYKPNTELQSVDGVFVHLKFKSDVCEQPVCSWMMERVLLDPEAWKAVGNALGNKEAMYCAAKNCDNPQCEYAGYWDWKRKMVNLMEHLVYGEGKPTVDEYIATL